MTNNGTMSNDERGKITVENARIFMRNFSGRETRYIPEGKRHFMLALPNDEAAVLKEDGWNISYFKPREEGDEPQAAMRVWVNYNYSVPPEIYMVVGRKKTLLREDTVGLLDNAEIVSVDLRIRPRRWGDETRGGIKAYLEKMYITVVEDNLDAKYNFGEDDETPF